MTFIQVLFYLFSTSAVLSALMVVSSRDTIRSVLFLVLAFFSMAGIWMLLHAEFLSLILVLVYVGAVMTLFLFVVMMLNMEKIKLSNEGLVKYVIPAVFMILAILGLSVMVLGPQYFGLQLVSQPADSGISFSNIESLGAVLYTEYVFPFEIAAVLLLTAIIAAISLTFRPPKKRKTQVIADQIAVRRQDRVRLVKVASEPKIKLSKRNTP